MSVRTATFNQGAQSLQNTQNTQATNTPAHPLENIVNGKYSCNWQDNVMLAGMVLAVGSAIGAFFLNMTAAAISFFVLGVLLSYSAYYVHNFDDGQALQQRINQLTAENAQLQNAKTRIERGANRARNQVSELQRENERLNQSTEALRRSAQNFQSENQELINNNRNMQTNLQQLREHNKELQERTVQLKNAIPILAEQVASFSQKNIQLCKDISVDKNTLHEEVKTSSQTIDGCDMTFDKHVLALSEQIHLSQKISSEVFSSLQKQSEKLSSNTLALQSNVNNLENIEKTFKQRSQELNNLQVQIEDKENVLNQLDEKTKLAKESLEKTTNAHLSETQRLSQIQSNIATQEEKLINAKKELLAYPQKLEEAENSYKKKIEEIENNNRVTLQSADEIIKKRRREALDAGREANTKKKELETLNKEIAERAEKLRTLSQSNSNEHTNITNNIDSLSSSLMMLRQDESEDEDVDNTLTQATSSTTTTDATTINSNDHIEEESSKVSKKHLAKDKYKRFSLGSPTHNVKDTIKGPLQHHKNAGNLSPRNKEQIEPMHFSSLSESAIPKTKTNPKSSHSTDEDT